MSDSRIPFIIMMVQVLGFLSSRLARGVAASRRPASAFMTQSRARSSARMLDPRVFGLLQQDYRHDSSKGSSCRHFASINDDSNEGRDNKDKKSSKSPREKPRRPTSKKIKVKEITQENIDKLAAAFDDLARKEGFDSSTARHAKDATFEDYFDGDDDGEFMDDEDVFMDEEAISDNMKSGEATKKWGLDDILDSSNFVVDDFDEEKVKKQDQKKPPSFNVDDDDDDEDDDDDFLDFGGEDDDDMDARIAAAQRDVSTGRVSVPGDLDRFADRVDLSEIGFRKELNPFGNDETPRKDAFKLITNAMTCSACGSDFQSRNEQRPGYLPPEKFEIQTKLSKIEEMQLLKAKAESAEWTPEDEVEYLIQTSGGSSSKNELDDAEDIDINAMANEMGLDLVELSKKKVICRRCHGLQNFGRVEKELRPGWTDEPTMSQEQFRDLLKPISEKPAVLIALVDLFDFSGSVLRELDGIAGENPVILAANKMDLLPSKMGKQRAENWVRRELEYMGVQSLANVGGAVRLVSCKTGAGVKEMLEKARNLADELDGDVYVVGAANAGKSTLINHILGREEDNKPIGKVRAGNRNAMRGALTTSPLPGTTLKFIKVDLGEGRSMYDTPGLLVPGTFTQLLTPEELKVVCPRK